MKTALCQLTKQTLPLDELVPYTGIRKQLIDLITRDLPTFSKGQFISAKELDRYRQQYLNSLIKRENKELNKLEREVLTAIRNNNILSEQVEPEIEATLTLGQRVADRVANFGGSWTFIILFFTFLMIWMTINIWVLSTKPFDPYPFILLNLILSCLAAIQAPIIMMSQNRQEQKDRTRSEHDYQVNLKAELEIKLLNEKVDHILVHQNKRLLEIQEIQLEYLERLVSSRQGPCGLSGMVGKNHFTRNKTGCLMLK